MSQAILPCLTPVEGESEKEWTRKVKRSRLADDDDQANPEWKPYQKKSRKWNGLLYKKKSSLTRGRPKSNIGLSRAHPLTNITHHSREPLSREPIPQHTIPQEIIPQELSPHEPIPREPIPWDPIPQEPIPQKPICRGRISQELIPQESISQEPIMGTSPLRELHNLASQPIVVETTTREKYPSSYQMPTPPENTTAANTTKEKARAGQDPGSETVLYVNNLFSPVNKLHAIPMGLDELRRRTEYPEYFGRSELVSYLRHSKTTGNEIISKYNLNPGAGRPRLNVLSRLCEREAKTLANGIHKMNNEYFPTSYVTDRMVKHMDDEKALKGLERVEENDVSGETKDTVSCTIDILENLKQLLRDPKEELAKDLDIFERVTHTFGCQNIVNHISFIESCLGQLKEKL